MTPLTLSSPTKASDGEIVVTSKEELQAAPLNGKRLLALWNALPEVDKRRKVGDRAALIEQLWSAIEGLPDPEPRGDPKRHSKQDVVIAMLRQPQGRNGRRGGERQGFCRWRRCGGGGSRPDSGRPAPRRSTAFRDG